MPEKSRNTRGKRLQTTEIGAHFMDNILDGNREISGMDTLFEAMIQIFIRITFWGVRREEKDLYSILVTLQPGIHQFAVMHAQIVQDQEYFFIRICSQPSHELDQFLLIHGIFIDHIAQIPPKADRRDHIHPFPLRFHRKNRRFSTLCKTPFHCFTAVYSRLIRPVDFCIFFRCRLPDGWIFLLFPPLDALRILLPRTFGRTLARQAPASHIVRCTSLRYLLPVSFPHQSPHPVQRP